MLLELNATPMFLLFTAVLIIISDSYNVHSRHSMLQHNDTLFEIVICFLEQDQQNYYC